MITDLFQYLLFAVFPGKGTGRRVAVKLGRRVALTQNVPRKYLDSLKRW